MTFVGNNYKPDKFQKWLKKKLTLIILSHSNEYNLVSLLEIIFLTSYESSYH